ncbi:UDP-glucose--hexose-1-phosphate uridylyltransferase [Bacillus wiedmannii]|uniref:UDP-glucose--hexose-1-phosphate uridylyltransferase n=1 Tax=Bacillus wiedmannii TaxID=1890302 RepID=UPI000BF19D24|nr:UDP-glucose--hexose-1-phosphate uridylyltransferase [Bacillus wiedmannii]PEI81698.1 UDP-glucose--hexose-1-phosphate uridylyltransferase [Bacillus wiedmannii]PEO74675.1 UDP-glucose--hexose-1-phosphate uridylyltransferase [Bacillus wiedmannii]PFZ66753.1 UDP-glucose--hexose-1-phosphate uridylyltransferase [Bacillus wiedmannii]PHB66012.1 UDP-glucose--hexose-1-phosphate uridylyltransferase [Bacillus wiedmannii]PHE04696.1 UDP-glucose--hexose-1-phosphate uridylyltransferase [Bacillus wiedmannii]
MIYQAIQQLIDRAIEVQLIEQEDEIYTRNQILSLLRLDDFVVEASAPAKKAISELLEELIEYACMHKVIEAVMDEKEILASAIMDVFMSKPSVINSLFYEKYEQNPKAATNYFYELSKNSNYIQMKQISKNINYKVNTEYGPTDITINLSKPEKDPKQIARERVLESTNYPKCLLCIENEGYRGRIGHPARSNHRMIRMNLTDESWFLQYSPYIYFNEHCIVLSSEHRDMKIDRQTFLRLLKFVEKFPHYFLGSNADLPIVGGSILTHDHYQGGNYEFAMANASNELIFELTNFPEMQCSIIKWPMSVIRLRSNDIEQIVNAGEYILERWKGYSDPSVHTFAFTNDVPHNTITPIARYRNGSMYELDLVLRNNRTSEEHPLGIFHPHAEIQHIKKENIGLIEVMGLAVIPARLKTELQEVEKFLLNIPSDIPPPHIRWAEQLKIKYDNQIHEHNVQEIIREEVGRKFIQALEDAGVFKRDDEGISAFKRIIQTLN